MRRQPSRGGLGPLGCIGMGVAALAAALGGLEGVQTQPVEPIREHLQSGSAWRRYRLRSPCSVLWWGGMARASLDFGLWALEASPSPRIVAAKTPQSDQTHMAGRQGQLGPSRPSMPGRQWARLPRPAWKKPKPQLPSGFGSIPISVPHVRKELGHGPRGREGCEWPPGSPPIRRGTRDHLARDKTAGVRSTALHRPRSAHSRNSLLYSTLPRTAPRSPRTALGCHPASPVGGIEAPHAPDCACRPSAAFPASAFAFAPALACLLTWLRPDTRGTRSRREGEVL